MIKSKIANDLSGRPALYFRRRDGSWVDALDWAKNAKLQRPGVWTQADGKKAVVLGSWSVNWNPTEPGGDIISFMVSPAGRIITTARRPGDAPIRLCHDGIDATDEMKMLLRGEAPNRDPEEVQKLAEYGHFSEVGFYLLMEVLHIAAKDFIAYMKAWNASHGPSIEAVLHATCNKEAVFRSLSCAEGKSCA
ncbi:hypothetical protein WH158_06820 [Gluconobacter cerinus]|uniref:hypothetical protein n=1 Tax=Gluconobacter cerinus TaxID=38307 RepID=UPI0030A5D06E